MISTSWLKKRKLHWARLEQLVQRSGTGSVRALSHMELRELGLLYRQAASDLSTVREDPTSAQLARHLNQLLGRAHNLIYMGRRAPSRNIWTFYRWTYPRIFRETLPYTLAAFSFFFLAALVGWLVTTADPGFPRLLVGGHMMDTIERRQMWTHSILTMQPVATSAIMTNNLAVSFATFAYGISAGIGTIWMMLLNGLLLGVLGAACWQAGMGTPFWSFVAPHGSLELPAVFIAGGAGLLVARGLLFPGWMSRRDSLVHYGGLGVRLVLGVIPLLVIAGIIEGFFSPSKIPVGLKFAFAGAMFALLVTYLNSGRSASELQPK